MIECLLGLIIGWFAGRIFGFGIPVSNGLIAIVVFLAVADELVASVRDTGRKPVKGLLLKMIFCVLILWIERVAGAPLAPFLVLILIASLFMHLVFGAKSSSVFAD
ncbi:MAG TPA: hypothetical protein PLN69_11965 [bacterium]|nr:hypothetical protein [bacterium]